MARLNRKPKPGDSDEPPVDGERKQADGEGTNAPVRQLNRKAVVPSRPSLRMSPLLGAMPSELVETFHYLVARLRLEPDAMLSPIAVVAATHGEGVTTVTRALGAVLANDLDASVCIVDLSSPTPANHKDAGKVVGLFDVVDQGLPLTQALRTTADDRLMVLASGVGTPAQARQLIRTPLISQVFDELAATFDYVLIDVPPILVGSSGVAMLRYARSYVMVVRHGATPIAQVRAAADQLESLESIGVVLNHVSTRIPKRLRRFFIS
jgi:Mrp family chromosome partitioning ATPase